MFGQKIVFVVGAGASAEFGLPVGSGLKQKIASKLRIAWRDGYDLASGDERIVEALRRTVRDSSGRRGDINPYVAAGHTIAGAMGQAFSIDNFIDAHQGNEKIELCGKLAIAASIIDAESKSKLMPLNRRDNQPHRHEPTIDFVSVENTWLGCLQKMLFDGVPKTKAEHIFQNISFVTFNYDRCIEHFFLESIINYYDIPRDDAVYIVDNLKIFHAYGKVGFLPWQTNR